MNTLSVSIDVPSLEDGVAFYGHAFGFEKKSAPAPGIAVLAAGGLEICLLEKPPGTRPAVGARSRRHYTRHWTPVHLDIHVDDLAGTLQRVAAAGAKVEQRFGNPQHGAVAFCSDPFGHGFCLIERVRPRKADRAAARHGQAAA
ncbi:MAG: VOC family protein [Rubrivivax sp.]